MVQEIADIYGLSREEKYDLFESLNLDDYNRFEGPVTDVISIVGKETAEQVAKEATSEVIKERCNTNCIKYSRDTICY